MLTRFAHAGLLVLAAKKAFEEAQAARYFRHVIRMRQLAKNLKDSLPRERKRTAKEARVHMASLREQGLLGRFYENAKSVVRSMERDAFRFLHMGYPLPEIDEDPYE